MTDREAAEKHGLTARTVRNYRRRLETDPELAELFRSRLRVVREEADDWLDELEHTIGKVLAAVQRCADKLNPHDPDALNALAAALRVLSETHLARRVIDARLAQQSDQPGAPDGEAVARFGATPGIA